jgi:hypothetical protein
MSGLMMRVSKTWSSPAVGGAHGMEHRHALGGAIDAIEHEAMQMDVEQQPL